MFWIIFVYKKSEMRAILSVSNLAFNYFNVAIFRQVSKNICVKCETSYLRENLNNRCNFHTFNWLYKSVLETNQVKVNKDDTVKPAKKKKEQLTYITLEDINRNVTVTTLEDALKLAKRRDLKLIKIKDYDKKTDRPTFKLMTTTQYLHSDENIELYTTVTKKSLYKGTKLSSISSKINSNDLNSKIKNILKWLDKHFEVRIVISNDNGEAENVFSKIADCVKESGKIVLKRQKGPDLRFQILPLKKDPATSTNNLESPNS